MGVAHLIILIIVLLYYIDIATLKDRDESYEIAIWLFGWPDIISDDLTLWDRENVKLTIEPSSMPIRLYVQLDPIDDDNVAITSNVISRRLALMSSDTITYNFSNFQFSIKDKTLISAFKKALSLHNISKGLPSLFGLKDDLRLIIDFKNTFLTKG